MKFAEVIASLDNALLLLTKHRCVAGLREEVVSFKSYTLILYRMCTPDRRDPNDRRDRDDMFTRCFMGQKTLWRYQRLIAEVRRKTTAQLTTGMPMFKQKAKQSIALRNKLLLKK